MGPDAVRDAPTTLTLHGRPVTYVAGGQRPGAAADPRDGRAPRELAGGDRAAGPAHTVIAPDLPGHGSRRPAPATTRSGHSRPACATCSSRSATSARPLVGHSLGGGIAMQFAYQFPEMTERLVLVSSGGLGPEVSAILRAAALPGADLFIAATAGPGRSVGSALARGLSGRRAAAERRRRRGRARLRIARGPRPSCGVPRDAAIGRRHRRPARARRRPAVPRRGHARPDHLGGARSDHPASPRRERARGDSRAVALRCSKGSATCRSSRHRGASSRCSSGSSPRTSQPDSTPSSGAGAFARSAANRRSACVCDAERTNPRHDAAPSRPPPAPAAVARPCARRGADGADRAGPAAPAAPTRAGDRQSVRPHTATAARRGAQGARGVSRASESRAETVKLARLLGVEDPRSSRSCSRCRPPELRDYREAVTDLLYDEDRELLQRPADASRLLPARTAAVIGERALGPLICARLTSLLDPRRAVEISDHFTVDFIARLSAELDPRRAAEVVTGIATDTVVAVSVAMAANGEHVAMGRFVAYLDDAALSGCVRGARRRGSAAGGVRDGGRRAPRRGLRDDRRRAHRADARGSARERPVEEAEHVLGRLDAATADPADAPRPRTTARKR